MNAGRQSLLLKDQICLWLHVDKEVWTSWLKGVSLRCHIQAKRSLSKSREDHFKAQQEVPKGGSSRFGRSHWFTSLKLQSLNQSPTREGGGGGGGWYFILTVKKVTSQCAPTSHLVSRTCCPHWHSVSEGPRRAGQELMEKDESAECKGRCCHQNKVSPSVTETESERSSTVDWTPDCYCSEAAAACRSCPLQNQRAAKPSDRKQSHCSNKSFLATVPDLVLVSLAAWFKLATIILKSDIEFRKSLSKHFFHFTLETQSKVQEDGRHQYAGSLKERNE